MKEHSIYALCEPGTTTARYVGRTSQPLKVRLCAHLSKARTSDNLGAVGQWVSGLLKDGKQPDCILLANCPDELAKEVERAWIVLFIDNGYDMLNVLDCFNMGKRRQEPGQRTPRIKKQSAERPPEGLSDKGLIGWYADRWHLSTPDFITAVNWAVDHDCSIPSAVVTLGISYTTTNNDAEPHHDPPR